MRGNRVQEILEPEGLEKIQKALSGDKNLTNERFLEIAKSLKGTGVGLSTLTKLLYFSQFSLDGLPCLIFDRRIIEVCNNKVFSELAALTGINEHNKTQKYTEYLKTLVELAEAGGYEPDQLELFLFQFGGGLKPVDVSAAPV